MTAETTQAPVRVDSNEPARTGARSPWTGFLLRRIGSLILSLWLIATLVFFLARAIGGDAVRAAAGLTATPEYIAAERAALGLDDPLLEQYLRFIGRLFTFDFGTSISTGNPVIVEIGSRLPYTVQLGLYSFVLAMLISIPLGIWMAVRTENGRGAKTNISFNALTGFFASVPDFLIAIALVMIFAVGLRWLPAAGGSGFTAFILPVITMSLGLIAVLSRLMKAETTRVLREDYIRTARANNLPQRVVLFRHVLPNVLTATLTYSGMTLASLLGGAIITETVFGWPGIGNLLVKSIAVYDYTLLEGLVILIATFSLVTTFIVDLILAKVDPKSLIRSS
ncbi:ABC transporter permease [Leucobacter sp. UT-8R-CII-1-4]|uniref:ABC transporter permease n=1 Tax=Leucobacter sp. UT-8R-CII-1-4 TaxID=3040075 RepID=UPI0024A82246|nr:ABC transporter permease [Leucobacter sp. UT-8R-CII-1-4]MDI6022665.1 ABC transporter permease [Leucobacter sp. UT-8R-CII-1-4]